MDSPSYLSVTFFLRGSGFAKPLLKLKVSAELDKFFPAMRHGRSRLT